jgi:hypothetical protein
MYSFGIYLNLGTWSIFFANFIELPNTTIIWSQILSHLKWRYSENQTAMHEVVTELLILLHPLLQNLVVIISGQMRLL